MIFSIVKQNINILSNYTTSCTLLSTVMEELGNKQRDRLIRHPLTLEEVFSVVVVLTSIQ